jgi:hypothetical protein
MASSGHFMTPLSKPLHRQSSPRSQAVEASTKAFCAGLPGDYHPHAEAAPADGLIGQEGERPALIWKLR